MISEKQKTLTAAKPQGSQPITPEPAPSPRLWASAWARPLADAITLTRTRKYHASKGTFLPCWKRGHFHFALATAISCLTHKPDACDLDPHRPTNKRRTHAASRV